MWVRVTCPNGHRLKIQSQFLGRSNRCPKCNAHVYLWIQVVCPQGHSLKVKSLHAGKQGRCPMCKDSVRVPDIMEAVALDTLSGHDMATGDKATSAASSPAADGAAVAPSVMAAPSPSALNSSAPVSEVVGSSALIRTTRICPACKDEIPRAYRTCPHCNHYIGEDTQQDAPQMSLRCPDCGQVGFPGEAICTTCGIPLVHHK